MSQVTINNGDLGLTVRTALNSMFTELYADAASPYPVANTFADLPAASSKAGSVYLVETTTGVFLVNRRAAGLYFSNGSSWVWLGDVDLDAGTITNTPAGNISSTTVQAALNELDSEKAAASSLATVATSGSATDLSGTLSSAQLPTNQKTRTIIYVVDGGGSPITTGLKGYIYVPFACTITEADLLADQAGSIVVNVWKCAYSAFDAGATHPVAADKITASAPPTISSAVKAQDGTLTGWTASISAGDVLAFNVDSISTIQRVTLALKVLVG